MHDGKAEHLILHVGQPKSGTTTLQLTFEASHDALPGEGVLYPGFRSLASDDDIFGRECNHKALPPPAHEQKRPVSGPEGPGDQL